MSEENVEIVRRVYDAAARRDTSSVIALYGSDIEWDISNAPARELLGEPHVYHGHEGLRRFFREWYYAWEHVEPDLEELIDADEHVISVETTRGRGRASGAEVELSHYAVWTIQQHKIVRVVWFGTRDEALEAAGVRELGN
jgi:ketosteroid isomerase-like protein